MLCYLNDYTDIEKCGTSTYCSASETVGNIQYTVGLMPYSNTMSEILDNVFHGNIFSLQWYSFMTLLIIQFLITNLRILKHYQSLALQHLGLPYNHAFSTRDKLFTLFIEILFARDLIWKLRVQLAPRFFFWKSSPGYLKHWSMLCPASNKGDDSSTGNSMLFTDSGSSRVSDNTSAVISFKLPSVLESCGKKPLSCRRSNSSSSSDEADSIPLQASSTSNPWERGSMSTQKPPVKSTPDFRSG